MAVFTLFTRRGKKFREIEFHELFFTVYTILDCDLNFEIAKNLRHDAYLSPNHNAHFSFALLCL